MAIDKMQRVTLLVPRCRTEELVAVLQQARLVHLEDSSTVFDEAQRLERPAVSSESVESRLEQVGLISDVLDELAPAKRSFAESLVPVPMRVSEEEVRKTVRDFQVEPLHEECRHIREEYRRQQKEIQEAESETAELEFFARLPFELSDLRSLGSVHIRIGSVSERRWVELQLDPWIMERLAVRELFSEKRLVHICVVALNPDRDEASGALRRYDFAERQIPAPSVPVADRMALLRRKAEELRQACKAHRARVAVLAQHRRQVAVVRGYWLAEQARIRATNSGAAAKRIAMFTGYVRATDAARLTDTLAQKIPQASVLLESPTPDQQVPVSISSAPLLKPMRFLVDMFGRPDYFSFDPTPYLSLSFLIFFGFCFSDVLYGVMLCGVAGYLAWKARHHEGLKIMCMMFLYCGLSTVVIGMLTGSWAADLWRAEYLGEGNPLLWLKEHTALVDPLDKPILMLLVALALGVVNQFYAILLKGYGMLRRGDVRGAVYDAGLWLVMLPGFLLVSSALFFNTPAGLFRTGIVLMACGGLGLVLTQGRHETSVTGKAITGLVSLYGILGSYGCVSFMGDMLSYSRLLALGLTTFIIGMSFNIMAGLVQGVPWVGSVLFVAMLVLGHAFNFAVSILGAFVHPARLIFLEFFTRFYEGSGVRFRPLSPDSEQVVVTSS